MSLDTLKYTYEEEINIINEVHIEIHELDESLEHIFGNSKADKYEDVEIYEEEIDVEDDVDVNYLELAKKNRSNELKAAGYLDKLMLVVKQEGKRTHLMDGIVVEKLFDED